MNIFQKTGLVFFVLASALLISLLFLNNYSLSESSMSQATSDSTLHVKLIQVFEPEFGTVYTNSYAFNEMIEDQLQTYNETVSGQYGITEDDIDQIIRSYPSQNITYQGSTAEEIWSDGEIDEFKRQQFSDYTSWMEGKTYESQEQLRSELINTRQNINAGILEKKGFGDYQIKSLQLALSKQSLLGPVTENSLLWLWLTIGLGVIGAFFYILPKLKKLPGIHNDHTFHRSNTSRGWVAMVIGTFLILFYVVLYWFPEYMTGWMALVDPISLWLSGNPASQWFFYGLLYTLAIVVMGVRMLIRYRHSNYHIIRTISVMFFQTVFAFLIPEILVRLNQPSMDLKNIWPLNYTFFYDYNLEQLTSAGVIGTSMLAWGILLIVVGVPVITYFYGKRWYCSWVCGCGGLAETLGDPYRHLSDKSLKAWKIERWMVHGVLAFAIVMTAGVLYTYFTGASSIAGISTYSVRGTYGFLIGAAFAGVVGVGFYPFMGNRVWCRFGCPLAAYLGIVQRFKSRFRITTNGGQCISCGNCSTYCEMGIDVRWYAQRGQNIVRASCVGCGVCSSVCPRGVLKLENKEEHGRFGEPILIGNDSVKITG
jgi:Pyruvate/2-oxoacid:ferredoxin oxidoreductase delta subunit